MSTNTLMIWDAIRDTVTCSVCGFARGKPGVPLACRCRGWVIFWRSFIERRLALIVASKRTDAQRSP